MRTVRNRFSLLVVGASLILLGDGTAIGTGKNRPEVGVDAKTGKVLENSLAGSGKGLFDPLSG